MMRNNILRFEFFFSKFKFHHFFKLLSLLRKDNNIVYIEFSSHEIQLMREGYIKSQTDNFVSKIFIPLMNENPQQNRTNPYRKKTFEALTFVNENYYKGIYNNLFCINSRNDFAIRLTGMVDSKITFVNLFKGLNSLILYGFLKKVIQHNTKAVIVVCLSSQKLKIEQINPWFFYIRSDYLDFFEETEKILISFLKSLETKSIITSNLPMIGIILGHYISSNNLDFTYIDAK